MSCPAMCASALVGLCMCVSAHASVRACVLSRCVATSHTLPGHQIYRKRNKFHTIFSSVFFSSYSVSCSHLVFDLAPREAASEEFSQHVK